MSRFEIENLIEELEPISDLSKDTEDDIDTILLAKKAENYLLSHPWCNSIENGWLAVSWGYIMCVFLFKITSDEEEVDDYVWMVVGDLPYVYVDIESATEPKEVLECYVDILSDWVDAVESDDSVAHCYPVEVPPDKEYARMLKSKLGFISKEIAEW